MSPSVNRKQAAATLLALAPLAVAAAVVLLSCAVVPALAKCSSHNNNCRECLTGQHRKEGLGNALISKLTFKKIETKTSCVYDTTNGQCFERQNDFNADSVISSADQCTDRENQVNVDVPHRDVDVPHIDVNVPHRDVNVPHRDVGVPHKDVEVLHRDVDVPQRDVDVLQRDVDVPQRDRTLEEAAQVLARFLLKEPKNIELKKFCQALVKNPHPSEYVPLPEEAKKDLCQLLIPHLSIKHPEGRTPHFVEHFGDKGAHCQGKKQELTVWGYFKGSPSQHDFHQDSSSEDDQGLPEELQGYFLMLGDEQFVVPTNFHYDFMEGFASDESGSLVLKVTDHSWEVQKVEFKIQWELFFENDQHVLGMCQKLQG